MRLLIVAQNYAPEPTGNAPYTTGLAEHLVSRGHQVTVLTGVPHYPSWRPSVAPPREVINGVEVYRRRHHVPRSQSAARRLLYEGSFLASGLSGWFLPRPDAVLGVVPSLAGGVLARLIAGRFRVRYGLIFQDLVGLAAAQSGVAGGGRVSRLVSWAEGWAARRATTVGVVAEGFRPYVESLGVDAGRVMRVRNWSPAAKSVIPPGPARKALGLENDAFVCLYAGSFGHKQGLEQLLECALLARGAAPDMSFVLQGDGSQRPALEERASVLGLENVRFLPPQSAEVHAAMLAAADALVLCQRRDVAAMSLPSKITSYLLSGRPVVAAVSEGSEAARELAASGAALVTRPDDGAALLDAVMTLRADRGLAAALGAAGRDYAERFLAPDAALPPWERLVLSLAGEETTALALQEAA